MINCHEFLPISRREIHVMSDYMRKLIQHSPPRPLKKHPWTVFSSWTNNDHVILIRKKNISINYFTHSFWNIASFASSPSSLAIKARQWQLPVYQDQAVGAA